MVMLVVWRYDVIASKIDGITARDFEVGILTFGNSDIKWLLVALRTQV